MFEKSLYDLIRGLRNHKGNEKEYIQNNLKECRAEIRGKDMDLKATALLKLVYLEMFGHDMSWAAFHVLEVMSSAKYIQKRVGYLGAVQSFRPDTEVLMLATNLLKKDLASASLTTISLPIITLPHIITSSLAMSVLSDLLPRLTHSSPAIRKKTIVTLYRLALCYPETLRPAWPKIKDRLMDENEDSSVTASIINVVCELGWRRPQDFLPLAPRLFELLVDSGNNWMAIKLIKLFATLTPLEPRLVRKLLPPLTSIIRTTPAMSLLYECINGIIQGGILGSGDDAVGGDEIATLCVNKLRGMIMIEGDPNLKYVALLAFNKIVLTHPNLVAEQEDVIMDCLDSPDISIRLRALDLVVGMVNADNLISIVNRLMRQLRNSNPAISFDDRENDQLDTIEFELVADSDGERSEAKIKSKRGTEAITPLPEEYKIDIIRRIIEMCSTNNYDNLTDFEWYIDILLQLVFKVSLPSNSLTQVVSANSEDDIYVDIAERVGEELRNTAVKVKAVRAIATRAAESVLLGNYSGSNFQVVMGKGALRPIAWIVGEYPAYLSSPEDTLTSLLHIAKYSLSPAFLAVYLQAIPKVFSFLAGEEQYGWTLERKTMVSLIMARIVHLMEPLVVHPDLDVQERAVEFCELLHLAAEASVGQEASSEAEPRETPLLLSQAIPSLFSGLELNSVASSAQYNVPLPITLDLNRPINEELSELLKAADLTPLENADRDDFEVYYHRRPISWSLQPAANRLSGTAEVTAPSYQYENEESYLDPDVLALRRAERRERNKYDPFYIAGGNSASSTATSLEKIIRSEYESDNSGLDIDSIPVMQLDLGQTAPDHSESLRPRRGAAHTARQLIQVAADETLSTSGTSTPKNEESEPNVEISVRNRMDKLKNPVLLVDSSSIGAFSLENNSSDVTGLYRGRQEGEEIEMAKAMQEVEKLRLEMQRANERIQAAHGVPPEGTLVKKKVKKKTKPISGETEDAVPRKTKLKESEEIGDGLQVVLPKKKKKGKGKANINKGDTAN